MKAFQTTDFKALVGIDWADRKHDICTFDPASKSYSHEVISATPQGIHEWVCRLSQRYPDGHIAVGCELTKGPLVYALEQYEHIVIFPINPMSVAKYREAFTHSGAKDDPRDARVQTEVLQYHMDKLKPLVADNANIRTLARLVKVAGSWSKTGLTYRIESRRC